MLSNCEVLFWRQLEHEMGNIATKTNYLLNEFTLSYKEREKTNYVPHKRTKDKSLLGLLICVISVYNKQ